LSSTRASSALGHVPHLPPSPKPFNPPSQTEPAHPTPHAHAHTTCAGASRTPHLQSRPPPRPGQKCRGPAQSGSTHAAAWRRWTSQFWPTSGASKGQGGLRRARAAQGHRDHWAEIARRGWQHMSGAGLAAHEWRRAGAGLAALKWRRGTGFGRHGEGGGVPLQLSKGKRVPLQLRGAFAAKGCLCSKGKRVPLQLS